MDAHQIVAFWALGGKSSDYEEVEMGREKIFLAKTVFLEW